MVSVKETPYFDDVLKEFNYDFGDVFVFPGYIISEMREGVTVSWDEHMNTLSYDLSSFLGSNGEDFIYISHRINSYSVMPSDWLKFFKHSYTLKGYGIVGYTHGSTLNAVIENLFFNKKIKRFNNLDAAIIWAKEMNLSETKD